MGVGDLAHVFADLDLGHDGAVILFHGGQLIHAAKHGIALAGDHPLAYAEEIHPGSLPQNVLNDVFVQRVGGGDLATLPARFIQHPAGFLGQIRNIAGVQSDAALGDASGSEYLVKGFDGVRHTGFEGIIGIHQQRGVGGENFAVGLERLILRVKHLHPRVSHGAAGGHAEQLVGNGAGSPLAAADIGRPCAGNGGVRPLCAAGTKFQHHPALRSPDDPVCLGRYQTLVVEDQQQERLHQLGLNGRCPDGDHRLLRENGSAFRDGPDVAGKTEIPQVAQKRF